VSTGHNILIGKYDMNLEDLVVDGWILLEWILIE
jgi:hypothetical protein